MTTPNTSTRTRRPALRALTADTTAPAADPFAIIALPPATSGKAGPRPKRADDAASRHLADELDRLFNSVPYDRADIGNPLADLADGFHSFLSVWVAGQRRKIIEQIEAGDRLDTPRSRAAIKRLRIGLADLVQVLAPLLRDDI